MFLSSSSYEYQERLAPITGREIRLNSKISPSAGAYTAAQNRGILIAGLSCACVSLVVMRRCFRHRLVLFLIASDTCKAIWYFVFAVVSFANGPVQSSSAFCQASGYLLLLAVEASDFAILMIAVHTMIYIFRPTSKTGEGGLYPYRNWIPLFWLGPPFLAASLGFVQGPGAYVTSGTYCYLPKRPIWYRLALSWIPRYMIITIILVMYASIYIYVHIKFHSFRNLAKDDSTYGSNSASRRSAVPDPAPQPAAKEKSRELPEPPLSPPKAQFAHPVALRMHSHNSLLGLGAKEKPDQDSAPWDAMSFITTKPLQTGLQNGVDPADFATRDRIAGSAGSEETSIAPPPPLRTERAHSVPNNVYHDFRKPSEVPTVSTINTSYTGDTATTHRLSLLTAPPPPHAGDSKPVVDPLRNTRVAIRRQPRFLFIYPLIYLLMWAFPFAAHILNYSEHYVMHPPFWLSVVQTCSLALQAGMDSVVFSRREKPWRGVDENSRFSITFWGRKVGEVVGVGGGSGGGRRGVQEATFDESQAAVKSEGQRSSHWWEVDGRKRNDSIWMGTDLLNRVISNRGARGRSRERKADGQGEEEDGESHRSARSWTSSG